MEITKFNSRLFAVLEQVTVHLRGAQNTLTELGSSVLEKTQRLQEAGRARANDLRELLASSLDAIVVTSGKVSKFNSQLFAVLEQVTVHLRGAQNTLTELGSSVLEKTQRLQEAGRARANDLRELLASSLDAIVVTSGKVSKFNSQLFAVLEQVTVHLRGKLNTLTELRNSAFEKTQRLQEAGRARANDLRELLASSLDAIVVTSGKVSKFNSQLFAVLEQVTVHLRGAQNTLTELGSSVLEKTQRLQEAGRARANDLRELLASSLDVIVATSGKVSKFNSRLFAVLEQVTVHLRGKLNTLTELRNSAFEKTRRLQEARRARENDLRELLASSPDAIVVTNLDRQFVAANPNALHLFGISQTNIRQFTVDAFLLEGQLVYFDADGLPFISREGKHGECQIRCLDGRLRLAEYVFVANFVPFRHLFIFRNDRACARIKRVAA